MPHQVRTAALRGAILSRGKDGIPILVEALHNSDYTQAAAATRSAMELPGPEVGDALLAELPKTPSDRQGLVILVLADRHDSRILPVVLKLAKGSDAQLRVVAFRAMKQVGDASCVPALLDAAATGSDEVAKAAVESLESLQDKSVDAQLTAKLSESQGKLRMVLIELVGRRRAVAATAALWQAADDSDPAVRAAALTSLGAVADATALPKLLARMGNTKDDREAAALDKGVNAVCLRSKDPDVVASQLATALPTASQPTKVKILDQLNAVGGGVALKAVAAAARSDNAELQDAAFRVLGKWKRVDAAPVLLELHNGVADSRFKTRAIRAYIRIARQFDMAADRRAEMCRTALETAQRDDDKRLVLEILLRYPNDAMKAIAEQAAKNPALKDEASLVLMGMSSKGVDRAELGRALAQAGHTPVKLEIVKAEYGADKNIQDVTASLQKYAKNCRVIFLPSVSYNESFGGDPAPGTQKRLHIQYRINGKDAEVTLVENVTIILPLPK
jgi:HEAT repeat protein